MLFSRDGLTHIIGVASRFMWNQEIATLCIVMQLFKQNNFINSTYNLWVDQKLGVQQQLAQIQIRIQVIEIWTMEKIKFIGIWIIFSFFFNSLIQCAIAFVPDHPLWWTIQLSCTKQNKIEKLFSFKLILELLKRICE